MSKRNRYNNGYVGIQNTNTTNTGVVIPAKQYVSTRPLSVVPGSTTERPRPSDWLPLPDLLPTDHRFVGLFAIFQGASGNSGASADGNYLALSSEIVGSNTNYTVDWGNGVVQQYSSGATAQYQYNYESIPSNTISVEGYKQVIVQVYPSVQGNTMTTIDLHRRYVQPGLTFYSGNISAITDSVVPWLDIKIAGAGISTANIGRYGTGSGIEYRLRSLYKFEWVGESSLTQGNWFFQDCTSLVEVVGTDWTKKMQTASNMFKNCYSLIKVSPLNFQSATELNSVFNTCISLRYAPRLLNTNNVTSLSFIFALCYSLVSIPWFDTSKVRIWTTAFYGCYSLKSIPLLNTSSGVQFIQTFQFCRSLSSVPLFDTSNATTIQNIFDGCFILETVPPLNTSKCLNFSNAFKDCRALKSIPELDTSKATNMNSMFSGCQSLESIPFLNTALNESFGSMFNGCSCINTIPLIDTSNGLDFSSMFSGCSSLKTVPLFNTSKATNMSSMFSSSGIESVPLFNTQNVFNMSNMFNSCGSIRTIPQFNTRYVTNFQSMFKSCYSLISVPYLNGVSAATTSGFSDMFNDCPGLISIGGFTASSATLFSGIFTNTRNLRIATLYGVNASITYTNCNLSPTELNRIFTNLSSNGSGKVIAIGGNWGSFTCDRSIATAKGWTVSG